MSLGQDIRNSASWYKALWIVFYWHPLLEALGLRRPEENRPGDTAFAPSYPGQDSPLGSKNREPLVHGADWDFEPVAESPEKPLSAGYTYAFPIHDDAPGA